MASTITRTNGHVAEVSPATRDELEARYEASRGRGWVVFSAIVLGIAGVFTFMDGLLALSNSKVFAANATYVFSDLHTWGWIVTLLGAATVLAALSLLTGSEFARWFGITIAGFSAIGQLMFVHANPWWAVCLFAVDILVIYGLAAHAGSRLRLD